MSGQMSQRKGKAFEREIANALTKHFGVLVRRTPSPERWKSTNLGDLNASKHEKTILNDIFWEAKKREQFQPLAWYKKAVDDAAPFQIPVVVASKTHEGTFVFLSFDHFIRLLKELDGYRKEATK